MRNTGQALRLVSFVDETPGAALADLAEHAGAAAPRWTLAGGSSRRRGRDPPGAGGRADVPLRVPGLADAYGRVRRVEARPPDNVDKIMRDIGTPREHGRAVNEPSI